MNTILHIDGKPVTLENVTRKAQEVSFTLGGKDYTFRSKKLADGSSILEHEIKPGVWQRLSGAAWQNKDSKFVQLGSIEAKISEQSKIAAHGHAESPLAPTAPMPGVIRQIMVEVGDKISKGQPLVVMEAMKLQTTLCAGGDGKIEAVNVKVGDMVAEGTELVRIK